MSPGDPRFQVGAYISDGLMLWEVKAAREFTVELEDSAWHRRMWWAKAKLEHTHLVRESPDEPLRRVSRSIQADRTARATSESGRP